MSDRIDTDAKPSDLRAWLTFHDLDATEARRMALALLDDRETLRAEVDALRSREVPDSHTVIDGKLWRVIPSGFGYDDGSQSCRLVPTEVAQDQVDWRVMALRVKHENAGPECFCENPKPGAHAQSCPRFGMNP